jgi:hypothetical protein
LDMEWMNVTWFVLLAASLLFIVYKDMKQSD